MITETSRLQIRHLNNSDIDNLFEIYSDKEAMKYRGSKPFESKDDVSKMLELSYHKIKLKEEFRYAVIEKLSGNLIGTFLIRKKDSKECEIGYSIGKLHWKKGYGTELIKGMMKYIFVDYDKIKASTRKENISSYRLLNKVGFCLTEEFDDYYVFEITKKLHTTKYKNNCDGFPRN